MYAAIYAFRGRGREERRTWPNARHSAAPAPCVPLFCGHLCGQMERMGIIDETKQERTRDYWEGRVVGATMRRGDGTSEWRRREKRERKVHCRKVKGKSRRFLTCMKEKS